MQNEMNLDFLVVGAQKAGTTTIHDLLCECNEICLPWSKETHFFRDVDLFSNGWGWYSKQFPSLDQQCICGEVDPEYMYFYECADRIKQYVSSPRFVFVFREPISRAYSHYLMSKRRGYEKLKFIDALIAENERLGSGEKFNQIHFSYLSRGLYANQIQHLVDTFPESEMLFLRFEDMFPKSEHTYMIIKRLFQFIGAAPPDLQLDLTKHSNAASSPRFVMLRDFVYGDSMIKKIFGMCIPSRKIKVRILQFLDKLNVRKLPNDFKHGYNMSDIPKEIYSELIADAQRTEKLTGLDLGSWIEKYSEYATIK